MSKNFKAREPTPQSPEDALQAEATEAAALAMVARLKLFLASNKDRKIRDLQMPHIKVLTEAAISGWVAKRAEQAQSNPDIFDQLVRSHDPTGLSTSAAEFLLS